MEQTKNYRRFEIKSVDKFFEKSFLFHSTVVVEIDNSLNWCFIFNLITFVTLNYHNPHNIIVV